MGGCGAFWGHLPPAVWAEEKRIPVPVLSLHTSLWADSVHTLTCATMLLNTDLHGQVSEGGEHPWGLRDGPGLGWNRGAETRGLGWGQGRLWGTGEGSRVLAGCYPIGWGCQLLYFSLLPMATEHWKEHELPGIHQQPEWPAGWRELPQGAAEGAVLGLLTGRLPAQGLDPGFSSQGDAELRPGSAQISSRGQGPFTDCSVTVGLVSLCKFQAPALDLLNQASGAEAPNSVTKLDSEACEI